ncbi:MAG: DNA polymerase I, partial [Acidimicrobiia bacterium]|nr:DNA polymerase I [Acidimicrobiia bacterium]
MPTLALLDGHSLAYRAFYALPEDLATSAGQVTNAAYGFMRMLVKLLGDHHPDRLAVAWDVGRATFRSTEYPEYKAQRESAPDIFRSQLPLIDQVLTDLGIQQFRLEGYEADDVIATMARSAAEAGFDVLVVTGDRDAFQLIDDRISVLYTRRGISDTVLADAAWVVERYGIRPDQYVEYASLRGDNSDNLPGVKGVGEKTAAKLISRYGGLEAIYEHLDEQTPKLGENLARDRAQVFLNRRLMKLVDDVPVGAVPDTLTWTDWDEAATKRTFDALEFHTLWPDLVAVHPGGIGPVGEVLDTETTIVSASGIGDWLAAIEPPVPVFAQWEGTELAGLAIAASDASAGFIRAADFAAARIWLEDPAIGKALHDSKSVFRALDKQGIALAGVVFDVAVAAYVVNPASRSYSLIDLADTYCGLELISADRDEQPAQGTLAFAEAVGDESLDMAGRSAAAIGRLAVALESELDDRGSRDLFEKIEMPLVPVLVAMETEGIGVDHDYLVGLGNELRAELATLETAIHADAGEIFNINSTNQLRVVLYERLELPVLKKTSTGVPSTDASVLAKLDHPIVEHLLRYRELEKLRSTYVDGFLPLIADDGRIHTTFNQIAAATGRLSSDHPNLQNIPVRSETGRTIRRAFVARPDHSFVVADYSQIELRILAHLSRDPGLLAAFGTDDGDVHTATAASVFDVPYGEVTQELRRRAKAINFGLLYGMEAFGLADRLEISRDEARDHIDAYFARFPDVKAFMDSIVEGAKANGYTETM